MRDTIAIIGNDCVGCRSCEQSCPQKCISMKENTEGFLYPSVQYSKCAHCGVCLKKCPVSKPYQNKREPLKTYAFKEKDSERLFDSASGGASDVAVGAILKRGGIAYGAAYEDDFTVKHIKVIDESGRKKLQSSKYVQSDLNDCYIRVKKQLEIGRLVLFTGTPCQIAGLYAYLGKEYENLYTIDLVCHGVPSPKFFKKYVEWYRKQMGGRVIYYNFCSKAKPRRYYDR
jgi:coenzyme F420-reducing hydrogenase beta subunit